MKIAIVVGHNEIQKGALGVAPISVSEFDFNLEIAKLMMQIAPQLNFRGKIFLRQFQGSYINEINEVYKGVDAWGAQVSIELHFNAFNGAVRGTETLCGPSPNAIAFGMSIHKEVTRLLERDLTTDRGVKTYRSGMKGGASLITGRAPAVLVEPFFGDNSQEGQLVLAKTKAALAQAYLDGIASAFRHSQPAVAMSHVTAVEFAHWR